MLIYAMMAVSGVIEMSVSFYPYVQTTDADGQTQWSFPDGVANKFHAEFVPAYDSPEYDAWMDGKLDLPNPEYDSRFDVNMADRNAQFVLNELGLHTDRDAMYNSPPMSIEAFEAGLRATIARNPEPVFGIPGREEHSDEGPRMFHFGVADGYANRRFADLLRLVEAAREYGATHIGWG